MWDRNYTYLCITHLSFINGKKFLKVVEKSKPYFLCKSYSYQGKWKKAMFLLNSELAYSTNNHNLLNMFASKRKEEKDLSL
jgi:hypothetical protein